MTATSSPSRALAANRTGRHRSPIALRRHPLSRETSFETARFSFWLAPLCPLEAAARRLSSEAVSQAPVVESGCCERPAAAAGEHFLRGDECFPARGVRMEGTLSRSRSYRVYHLLRCARTPLCLGPLFSTSLKRGREGTSELHAVAVLAYRPRRHAARRANTSIRLALHSMPMPGASGTRTRLFSTGTPSAKPPKGSNTPG